MTTKLIRIDETLLQQINDKVGSKGSWTSKITKLLELSNKQRQTSAAVKPAANPVANPTANLVAAKIVDLTDYKLIKKIVEDALFDMKAGKI